MGDRQRKQTGITVVVNENINYIHYTFILLCLQQVVEVLPESDALVWHYKMNIADTQLKGPFTTGKRK
jgi:hypothetical protein